MSRDAAWLLDVVGDQRAVADLRGYFSGEPGSMFTGRAFEAIDGGGDRAEVRDRVTAADLVAVQMLSVQVPAEVAISVLDGDLGVDLSGMLTQIPSDVVIGTPEARRQLLEESHAKDAWASLTAQHGVAWVIAGKLLARKRPHLIPVYDDVVRAAIGAPDGAWAWFQAALEDQRVRDALHEVAAEAAVPSHVSTLRALDVILWMRHR